MPLRLLRRILVFAALTTLFVCLPSLARAQSIAVVQEASPPRVNTKGETISKRPATLKPEGVNYQDCVDDLKIRYSLQLSGFEVNGTLQTWAGLGGADCKQQQNRSGGVQTCWQLTQNLPLQANTSVDIPVRAIMSGASPFKPTEPATGDAACGQIPLVKISVQFLYFAPGALATPATNKDVEVEVNTIGPAAPSGLRVLPGNQRLTVQWDNISGEGGLTNLTGVKVYCDVNGGTPATTTTTDAEVTPEASCTEVPNEPLDGGEDAGTTIVCEDAGSSSSSSGGTPASACGSTNLAPPDKKIIPDQAFNDKYECGSFTGNTGVSAVASKVAGQPLTNGTMYALAVAATDAFNNVGPLSNVICQYPEVTNDFWENYRNAGGEAGGGLCTTTGPGTPVGGLSVIAVIALAAVSSLRRRRNRR